MQHFILTKVATGRPGDSWLRTRLELFRDYCLPSVSGQRKREFTWLLAMNPRTPSWFINALSPLLESANATVVFTPDSDRLFPNWTPLIEHLISSDRLLTSRLDSDDMLQVNFVDDVQRAAQQVEDDTVLDFPSGFQVRLPDFACRRFTSECPTHFISLVESRRQTVCGCGNHTRIKAKYRVHNVHAKPMWIELCHGGNLKTRFQNGGASVSWDKIKPSFVCLSQNQGHSS